MKKLECLRKGCGAIWTSERAEPCPRCGYKSFHWEETEHYRAKDDTGVIAWIGRHDEEHMFALLVMSPRVTKGTRIRVDLVHEDDLDHYELHQDVPEPPSERRWSLPG